MIAVKTEKPQKVKKILLTIAIVLVLTFFVNYALYTFYEGPRYEDFCQDEPRSFTTESACTNAGGVWRASEPVCEEGNKCQSGWCDVYYKCGKEFETVMKVYSRNVSIILLIAGAVILLLGIFIKMAILGSAFMGAGCLTIFIAIVWYWNNLSKYVRLLLLGCLLGVLIWIAYKRFHEK